MNPSAGQQWPMWVTKFCVCFAALCFLVNAFSSRPALVKRSAGSSSGPTNVSSSAAIVASVHVSFSNTKIQDGYIYGYDGHIFRAYSHDGCSSCACDNLLVMAVAMNVEISHSE
jgi:hypothetical protein